MQEEVSELSDGGTSENLSPLQRFGVEVREMRRGRKITQKHLANAGGYSEGYVCKVEAGTMMPSEKFAQVCDLAFGTHGLFDRMRRHIEEGDNPTWFVSYLQLERKASRILDFSSTHIMGMLQTEEYARAIYRAGLPRESEEVIQSKVVARMRRRDVLMQENPPTLWVILHEAGLRTPVGGPAVMAAQIGHLLKFTESPNVDLQVMRFSAGAAAAHTLPFVLLTFRDSQTILYAEDLQGGRIYRSTDAVESAMENYNRLRANAMSPDDSLAFIATLHKEYAP